MQKKKKDFLPFPNEAGCHPWCRINDTMIKKESPPKKKERKRKQDKKKAISRYDFIRKEAPDIDITIHILSKIQPEDPLSPTQAEEEREHSRPPDVPILPPPPPLPLSLFISCTILGGGNKGGLK